MSIKELFKEAKLMKVEDLEICQVLHTKEGLEIKLKEKDKFNFHFITIPDFRNEGK